MLGRLRKAEEFERVRKTGLRRRGKYCTLNAAPMLADDYADAEQRLQPPSRIGYVTARSLGSAVKRNRARRLMREAIRDLSDSIVAGWDIVLIAHSPIITEKARMQHVREDVLWLLNKTRLTRMSPTER